MPTESRQQFAAAKPAPEVMVWTRFWRSRLRNAFRLEKGILARAMANNAPITEVLGVVPILAMICIQIIAAKTDMRMLTIKVFPSKAFTCGAFFSSDMFFPPVFGDSVSLRSFRWKLSIILILIRFKGNVNLHKIGRVRLCKITKKASFLSFRKEAFHR